MKGDVLITFRKSITCIKPTELSKLETTSYFHDLIGGIIEKESSIDLNGIFLAIITDIFLQMYVLSDVNFYDILSTEYEWINGIWHRVTFNRKN